MPDFQGFSPEALQFLAEIRIHNSKAWYDANKPRYLNCLLAPFQALVGDLSDAMLAIDPGFITIPAVDKTISRIYRDTRFSKDKSLYRDNMWLSFKKPIGDWKEAPVFFFEMTPAGYRYGMGFYSASKEFMDRFRSRLREKPEQFLETVSFLDGGSPFTVGGERYKKILNPDLPPALQEWCQYKSFYVACNHPVDELLFSQRLAAVIRADFAILTPLYHYLLAIKNQMPA